jgi:nucleoside-diphosphate-sugar epimerase
MPETAKRQRILVLGASGFIGKHVVEALCDSDWAHPVATRRKPLQLVEPVERIRVWRSIRILPKIRSVIGFLFD